MRKVKYDLKEEIVAVVNPISQGSSNSASLYVLLPIEVTETCQITKSTKFLVIEAENGDIIYRRQGK